MSLNLEIVTPERIVLSTEADYVTIPGELGELGILPGHIPLLTNLQSGILSFSKGGGEEKLAVHYGYAEICRDKITILAKSAEQKADIDLEKSRAALQEAEKELEGALKDVEQRERAVELQQRIKQEQTRQLLLA